MAVGQNQSIRRDDHAGTGATAPARAGRFHAHNGRANAIRDDSNRSGISIERRFSLWPQVIAHKARRGKVIEHLAFSKLQNTKSGGVRHGVRPADRVEFVQQGAHVKFCRMNGYTKLPRDQFI
jgi:hypothetical protein